MNAAATKAKRIYLDNAATSWPKPESVYEAVNTYQRESGAPAGRGTYNAAVESDRMVQQLRRNLRQLCNAPHDSHTIFGFNGTDVLNLAIHGAIRERDHVIATVVDHNSVLRPLETLARRGTIELDVLDTDDDGVVSVDELQQRVRSDTRLVTLPHASNVTGAVQPLQRFSEALLAHPAMLLVDAAQTMGHLPIDLTKTPIDLLVSSGHKGLLGPLGTGVLLATDAAAQVLQPIRQGGTGTDSLTPTHPTTLPEKLEAGSLNVSGLAGLSAATEYVTKNRATIRAHEIQLMQELADGFVTIKQISIVGPRSTQKRVGVCSFTVEGVDPQELASVLDSAHNIQVRAGLQCAPRMHKRLGTADCGGTIRVSVGPFSTSSDIRKLVEAVRAYVEFGCVAIDETT